MPSPTMVRPIINGDMPKFRAIAEVPLTKKSAENIKKTKPASIAAILISISIGGVVWLQRCLLSHTIALAHKHGWVGV